MAFPPPEDEKTKKKAGKKDTKKKGKEVEEEKPPNPEMIALGQEVHPYFEEQKPLPDEILVKAIITEIKEKFPQFTDEY